MRVLLSLFIILMLTSCKKQHLLLIGTQSSPEVSKLRNGTVFGGDKTISVGSKKPFGNIIVKWDEKKEANFDTSKDFFLSRSIVLTRESGRLELNGELTEDVVILHLYGAYPQGKMTLKNIYQIKKTEDLAFKLNLK